MASGNGVTRVQTAEVAAGGGEVQGAADNYDGLHRAERYLCSLTYTESSWAEYIVDEFLDDSVHAIQPPFGLDVVALARHARAARRIARQVKVLLAVVLAGGIAVAVRLLAGALEPGVAHLATDQVVRLLRVILVVLAGCWLVSWVIVAGLQMRRYARVRTLLRGGNAGRGLARALPAADERQLAEAMAGNVTVFRGGEPLSGHGDIVGKWAIDVDLTKPAADACGQHREIVPLSASEVHGAVATAIHRSGIPDLKVENRFYVRGTAAPAIVGLLPDRFRRPRTSLPPEMVVGGIERPTPYARTYLRAEKVAWSGHLVLNMLIRAEVVAGAHLYIEFYVCGLLPLAPFARSPESMPKTRPEIFFRVLREVGLFRPMRELLGLPAHVLARVAERLGRRFHDFRDRLAIRRGHVFDYGPMSYVREQSSEAEHHERFAKADEDMYLKIVARRTLTAVQDVLAAHGIDTSQFDQLEKHVSSTVYNIGNISGTGTTVGNNNKVSSSGAQRK